MGCGRTDAGVHARKFYFHFDCTFEHPEIHLNRLNSFLPRDISIEGLYEVASDVHARFDANYRAYEYHLSFVKEPFLKEMTWQVPMGGKDIDRRMLDKVASLIKDYDTFFPFCKTNHDSHTLFCKIHDSRWEERGDHHMVYHIAANRFLRGMVRLIVGCSIRVATGKILYDDIKRALDEQSRIHNAYSAPAQGLFLSEVKYPDSVGLALTKD